MRVLSFSDIHGYFSVFKKAKKAFLTCDVLILSGDITDFGDSKDLRKCIKEIEKVYKGPVLAVIGNCDYPSVENELEVMNLNLHGKVSLVNGIQFVGLGGSLVTPFSTPVEYTESDYRVLLEDLESKLDKDLPAILVSHQPPVDCGCDRLNSGESVGSFEVRKFIERNNVSVCFSGHIHESVGKGYVGSTPVINPGMAKKGFAGVADISENNEFTVYMEQIGKII